MRERRVITDDVSDGQLLSSRVDCTYLLPVLHCDGLERPEFVYTVTIRWRLAVIFTDRYTPDNYKWLCEYCGLDRVRRLWYAPRVVNAAVQAIYDWHISEQLQLLCGRSAASRVPALRRFFSF